jgi:glycosyltransferase involved in cell wall biosynthesis
MDVPMKISVITPSYNTGRHIESAITSVLLQNYPYFEHIIIDGGSSDGTLKVLKKYPHLKWFSEPDQGQSDAMNKGFQKSTGPIIVYLNADDYFEEGAFNAVLPYFLKGAHFVMGRVKVLRDNGSSWINDPKTEFREMLKWWQKDAFCFNPAGYFYRREVQEVVGGFDIQNNSTMDLDFLLNCARRYEFVKIDQVLGTFRLIEGTKTFNCDIAELYSKKIAICDKYSGYLTEADYNGYIKEKAKNLRYLRSRIAVEKGIKDLKKHYKKHDWLSLLLCFFLILFWSPLYLPSLIKRRLSQKKLLA